MSNPLIKIEDYLDEVARVFVSQGYSTKYEAPLLYLIKELEAQASRNSSFSKDEFERSLEIVKEKIASRLEQGLWK
jgi:predicted Zn-dependent peptidase